ncbi:MAG: (d)CMP kinase [Nitrospirae bacterium]|nr:(d)CMP kinase [Nitrospirota bacterium]
MHIIAIDGPVGSGKSTIARLVAKTAGFAYLDTGAMYRAIGWKVYSRNPPPLNPLPRGEGKPWAFSDESFDKICATIQLDMELVDGHLRVIVDGKDISEEIRTPEISRMASAVSVFASVRKYLVRMQREIGLSWAKKYGGVVVEGRDIGTVVFPDTPFKFYLDADINERGKRRWKELQDKGANVTLEETVKEVISRDENDKNREIDPLRRAKDAIVIDTTGLSIEEVVEKILSIINQKSNP